MSGLVLSILLVVLIFGAVLWVVDGEQSKPTSAPPRSRPPAHDGAQPAAGDEPVQLPVRNRQRATSRRRPPPVVTPASLEPRPLAPVSTITAERPAPMIAARPVGPPLARHRIRSTALLVLLVLFVGLLVAVVIGVVASALAFALRSAVTS